MGLFEDEINDKEETDVPGIVIVGSEQVPLSTKVKEKERERKDRGFHIRGRPPRVSASCELCASLQT